MSERIKAELGSDPDPHYDAMEKPRSRLKRVDDAWYAAFDATEEFLVFAERVNARYDAKNGRVMVRNAAQYNRLRKQVIGAWTRTDEVEAAMKQESDRSLEANLSFLRSKR